MASAIVVALIVLYFFNFPTRKTLIKGDRNENRPLERIYDVLFPLISVFLVGKLKKYKTIKATAIADAHRAAMPWL